MTSFKNFFSYLFVTLGISLIGFNQTSVGAESVDDIVINNMNVKMELSRDSDKVSKLKTTETIEAQFNDNSHHGIYKEFIDRYNGHSTHFNVVSVKDGNGRKVNYKTEGSKLYLGDKSSYVSGNKIYEIVYTQDYVTRHYDNTNKDEFYWDVVGSGWDMPIKRASSELILKGDLKGKSSTKINCYVGKEGSNSKCSNAYDKNGNYYTNVSNIGDGKGMTIAIGFPTGTFKQYEKSLEEKIADYVGYWQGIQLLLMFPLAILLFTIVNRKLTRRNEIGTIIPEYTPPKNVSVYVASKIIAKYDFGVQKPEAAQLLKLAVDGYIQLYERGEDTLFKDKDYIVKIVKDLSTASMEDAEIVYDMFKSVSRDAVVGAEINLKEIKNSWRFRNATYDNTKKFKSNLDSYFGHDEKALKSMKTVLIVLLVISVLTLSFVFVIIIAFAVTLPYKSRIIKDKGLELARYLFGLKMYIKVAEKDRIKMLQSPDTAEKIAENTGLNIKDRKQLIKLYEKTLPYAVLFGQEKKWAKELGGFYEQEGYSPSWYSSSNGLITASALSDGIGSISSSALSSSSSSGGSSGGGSVGGGGGGGGGGGW